MNPVPAVKNTCHRWHGRERKQRSNDSRCAQENGISIPTLCHLDGLTEVGACRMCLVELKGSTKLQTRVRNAG